MRFKDFIHGKGRSDAENQIIQYSDQELFKMFRKNPSKDLYVELKKRGLQKHPLIRNMISERRNRYGR